MRIQSLPNVDAKRLSFGDVVVAVPSLGVLFVAGHCGAAWVTMMTFIIDRSGTLALGMGLLLFGAMCFYGAREIRFAKQVREAKRRGETWHWGRKWLFDAGLVCALVQATAGSATSLGIAYSIHPGRQPSENVRWVADGIVRHEFGLELGHPPNPPRP